MDRRFKIVLFSSIMVIAAIFFICKDAFPEAKPIHVDWTTKLNAGNGASKKKLNFASPVVAEDKAFVGSGGGFFYSIDNQSGKKLWETKLDGPVLSQPLLTGNNIYVGDGKGFVYSINPENGQVVWKVSIGEEVMSTPATDGKLLFVGTQRNSVFALDKETGAIKWSANRQTPFFAMSIRGASDPVVIDNKVYVGNTDGVLVGYNTSDGAKTYTLPVTAARAIFTDIDTRPLKQNNLLIFSTMEGALNAVDLKSGNEIWSQPIGSPNNIAYDNGLLYVTAAGKVYCIKVEKGDIMWEKDLNVPELSEAALNPAYVAVVSTDDKLYLLDRSSGEVSLERHLGGGTFGAPVISGPRLYVLSNSSQLHAFRIDE